MSREVFVERRIDMQNKKSRSFKTQLMVCVALVGAGFSFSAHAATYVTFDPPGSVGTYAVTTRTGQVAGW
jgi:hypothetical protein